MWIFRSVATIFRVLRDYFKSFLLILITIFLFAPSGDSLQQENLAKVRIEGQISNIDKTVEELREAYNSENIKGVLLIVDSGGGAVDKSIELSDMVKLIAKKKPVVTYASGTVASGSYYASIWSDIIISNRGSLVGSIGVIFDGINYRELAEKIGIESQVSKAGKFKESGTGSREWLPHEREEIEKVTGDMYQTFISDVAEARNLKVENHTVFADAHIFTARQAVEVGLIDRVGILIDAEEELKTRTGVADAVWSEREEYQSFLDEMSASFIREISSVVEWRLR